MSRHVLGMGLLAVTVAAQATLASSGFQYVGCVEADPKFFGLNIDFSTPFTPQQCQAACAGKATYTAIGGGCHCDVPSQQPDVTFKILDEAACAVLCIPGSPDAGRCGGSGEGETAGHKLYSLYKKATEARHAAAAAHKDEDCDKEEDAVAAAANMIGTVSVVIQTVYSCPPQKEDCPLRAATQLPVPASCPPGGCQPSAAAATISAAVCPPGGCQPAPAPAPAPAPTSTTAPAPCPPEGCAPVIINNKVPQACPAGGCRSCPPQGCPPCTGAQCLPACPSGCVAPPPPETSATPTPTPSASRSSACSGCNGPTTLVVAPSLTSTKSIAAPTSQTKPQPVPSSSGTAVSRGRQERVGTVELLTIVGAAIVLLAF